MVMSGNVYDANAGGVVQEIWSCSLAMQPLIGSPDLEAIVDDVADVCRLWFIQADAGIDKTASLESVKLNYFADTSPFHQISDPTIEHVFPAGIIRGGVTPSVR